MKEKLPLVSIIIITYNSAKFILETLDSAASQTYSNLELIISDDASTDNTLQICREWLAKNSNHFGRVHIEETDKNTGVAANCNRGINAAAGQWLKLCAGDDILTHNCIADNIAFAGENPEARFIDSLCGCYQDTFEHNNFLYQLPHETQYGYFDLTAQQQYEVLYRKGNFICTPPVFLHTETFRKNGMYDERFPFLEDYPMWLTLTRNGFKFYLMKVVTVKYRIHRGSVQVNNRPYPTEKNAINNKYFLKTFFTGREAGFKTKKEILKQDLLILFNRAGLNRRSFVSKGVFYLITKL